MDYSKIVDDNTIVICDSNIKNKILAYLNTSSVLYSIKFMNINEVIKSLFFNYDEKSIYYLMYKYSMPYEVAEIYIKNMYYVDNTNYKSDKLNKLIKYKKELDDNNLLIKNKLFIDYIKNNKIVVCMKKISKYDKYIIDILNKYTSVSIYEFKYNKFNHKVYEFDTIDKEIEYVAYSICDLISRGININDIKISNIDEDYINNIKRIFGYFNIPINLPDKSYIIGTKIGKDFVNNIDSDINKSLKAISKYSDSQIYGLILDICNKYIFIDDYKKVKDMIIHDLTTTLVPQKRLNNAIEVIDYKDIIEDEYVFLMNFNLKSIPKVYKDEDYITDNIKPSYLDTTIEKNKLEKEITIKCIDNIRNLVITYKKMTPTSGFYPSNLVELYELDKPMINVYKSYSTLNDKLKLASSLDKLIKYGVKDEYVNALKYNYDIPYMNYSNKYTNVDNDKVNKLINNKLSLSYTTVEQYNECAFKYYLSNILKINIYEDSFSSILGNIFHYILQIGINKDIDIDEEINKYLKEKYSDRVFSKSELFFINNSKKSIQFALDTIKKHMSLCRLDTIKTEERVFINKDRDIKITFTGVMDKFMFKEYDDKTIVAIIDYKTGKNIDIDLGYMVYGLGLQLPIYLYLAANYNEDSKYLKNIKYAGIYLQKIMPEVSKLDFLANHKKEDNLKLEGYSNSDKSIIEEFDITCTASEVIKSLSVTKDGRFSSNSKILNDKQFELLKHLAEKEVDKCINNIMDTKFDINPIRKETDRSITACEFCHFKDICFRTNNDITIIKKDKTLSFLGGDDNE